MFSNLHTHTCYSLLDSIIRPQDLVDFAVKNNQSAVCVTDHGTLSAFILMQKLCKKANIKCIMGVEIYEVDDEYQKNDTKNNKQARYHLLLMARNNIGKQNLINIVSHANTDGFYTKPRISIDTIRKNDWGKGIICCTACAIGRVRKLLQENKEELAYDYICKLQNTFDKVYCELQSHDTELERIGNKQIYDFAIKYSLPYVITTDAHMVNKEDVKLQEIFVRVGQDREVGESYYDCYLQTEDDVYRIMTKQFDRSIVEQGILATQEIVDMIEEIDVGLNNPSQMPTIHIPKQFSSNKEYLEHLCFQTFDKKFGNMSELDRQTRKERILSELQVLYELDYTDYFIMLYMISKECKKRNIALGYSRGSGGNCLCLYMLGVTQIDSVRWNLDFSRFANLGRRGSVADFDYDCDKAKRQEMIQVMRDLFGSDNVCQVSTFNSFSNIVAIKDIGKVMNDDKNHPYYMQIPISLRDEVAKTIPTVYLIDDDGNQLKAEMALQKAIKGNERLQKIYNQFPLWFDYAISLSGLPKSRGCHASAVMVTPKPIKEYCSICYAKDKSIMYECEMHSLMDDIKLVKMDVLGLKTLTIIDKTLEFTNLTWQDIDINHLDLDDKLVYEQIFQQGNTVGVFQMESEEAKRMLRSAKANTIEDIIVVNSANRPATKDFFPTYCYNKLHPDNVQVIHEDLRTLFSQSCCVLLYQEQALALLRYAGFPDEEVDNGRRAIGKKIPEQMALLYPKFVKGLQAKNWDDKQINDTWEMLVKQSSYSFNRGHAVSYSLLAYLTGWLKVKYPIEFIAACMICNSGTDDITMYCNECKRLGIKIQEPNINKSTLTFTPNKKQKSIMYGLGDIKGIKEKGLQYILQNRPFISYNDMLERCIDELDKSDIIALIKSGACDSITYKPRIKLLEQFFAKRYIKGKEEIKPLTKADKRVKKLAIDEGLVSIDELNSNEYCLQKVNEYRKQKAYENFYNKYCQNEHKWIFETLNTYLDNTMFDNVKLPDYATIDKDQCSWLAGYILSVEKKNVKSGKTKGQKMAFIKIVSDGIIYDIVVFPTKYNEYQRYLSNGELLLVLVNKQGDTNGIFQQCITLDEYKQQMEGVV